MLREQGCWASTRAKHLRVLGACLQAAVFYRYADSNPVRELPPAHRPGLSARRQPTSKTMSSLISSPILSRAHRTLCLVALKTGMGRGRYLRCGGTISISSKPLLASDAATRVGTLGTPSNRERRDVDLEIVIDVVGLLSCWRDKTLHPGGSDSLIFHGEDGYSFLTPPRCCSGATSIRRWQVPKISRVGPTQEKRTFHSFRHTFAKRALEWRADHVAVAPPRSLLPEGHDRHLRALGTRRAKASGREDGGAFSV